MLRTLVLAVTLASGAVAARRHLVFVRSEPADKAVLAKSPGEIRLYFNEKPLVEKTKIVLADSAGHEVTVSKVALATSDSTPVVSKVTGALVPGAYTVKWESASQDGHSAKGSFRFRVR